MAALGNIAKKYTCTVPKNIVTGKSPVIWSINIKVLHLNFTCILRSSFTTDYKILSTTWSSFNNELLHVDPRLWLTKKTLKLLNRLFT